MATKNTTKIKSIFAGLFNREEQKDSKTILSETREREKYLMSKLESLLTRVEYGGSNKLSSEKIKEYKIESRLARMRKLLETPLVSNIDTSALFQLILTFVDKLELAITEGYENCAYWSSMALHKSVESLWIPTPDAYIRDPEMEIALYASKLEYARNFSVIIELAKKRDTLEKERNELMPDHKRKTNELREDRTMFLGMRKTEAGRKLIASAESKRSDPTSLTEDEKAYVDTKENIDKLTDELKISLTELEAIDTDLITAVKEIENLRMQLMRGPDVEDPKLAAKIKHANEYFRAQITRQLDDAYVRMMVYEGHVTEMEVLRNHAAIAHRYAKVQETADRQETEELNRSLAELEARKEINRKAQNALMMQQQVQEIQQQTEELILPDLDIEASTDVDFEEEHEVETEAEYDYI